MKDIGLAPHELELLREVFLRFPAIREVTLYGSRAKGSYQPESDVDLVLIGVEDDLQAAAVADELDELRLPYRFDAKAEPRITYDPLREHIGRVGVSLYRRDSSVKNEAGKLKKLE